MSNQKSTMRVSIANYISDFIESPHFEVAPRHIKPQAETILQYLFDDLWADSLDIFEDTLNLRIRTYQSQLASSEETVENIGELVEHYFSYLETSGNIPGASEWSTCLTSISQVDSNKDREIPTTVRHTVDKTGRNAPCPCGSGLKFKKCCIGLLK